MVSFELDARYFFSLDRLLCFVSVVLIVNQCERWLDLIVTGFSLMFLIVAENLIDRVVKCLPLCFDHYKFLQFSL